MTSLATRFYALRLCPASKNAYNPPVSSLLRCYCGIAGFGILLFLVFDEYDIIPFMGQENNLALIALEDDNESKLLTLLLQEDGFNVVHAASVQEGLDYINRIKFEVVISNGKSTNNDFQLLQAVKSISPATAFIIIGDAPSLQEQAEATKFGADAIINKPYKIDEFRFALNEAREKRKRIEEFEKLKDRIGVKYLF